MGYLTNGLTFNTLRSGNSKRAEQFPGRSSEWNLAQWMNAAFGELGEAANILKKIDRGDFSLEEGRARLAEELADATIYLDLLAQKAGIDLGPAVMDKWNRDSRKHGIKLRIGAEDWYYARESSHD